MPQHERHHREGSGFSDNSWIKHGIAAKPVGAQVSAFRHRFIDAKMLLIDGNAGDGSGVDAQQFDLFGEEFQKSRPTAQLLAELADRHHATLCLVEQKRARRRLLIERFPKATIVPSHKEAADYAIKNGFNYVLWLSDPCGYAGHGVDQMARIAQQVVYSDFVVILNELALHRVRGAGHSPAWQPHQKYLPLLDPQHWLRQLRKRFVARTPLIKQSSGFHFRVLVLSNFLTDGVRRLRHVEIIPRQDNEEMAK